MKTILLPIGPPGSGKSTLVNGLQQFMNAISRSCSVGNLDPANENIPYSADFDVRELVDVDEVMEREDLGPNGGLIWAMEELEANVDWLEEKLDQCVNVFTKIDNLKTVGGADLPFNLDFYTEVQDLHFLMPLLSQEQADATSPESAEKWDKLNEALIGLIENFGLVGFETCAVEDKQSMATLLRAIDRASGYVFAGARGTDEEGRTLTDEASIWAQAMSEQWQGKLDVRDVQERWIDRKDEFDEAERKAWEAEAKEATARPAASLVKKAATDAVAAGGSKQEASHQQAPETETLGVEDEEDEMVAEQRKWKQEQSEANGSSNAARTKVVRKI